jgi:cell wall integrity and stress response component
VQTVFITPSSSADPVSTADANVTGDMEPSGGGGISTGAIVGIVVGIALVIMLAVIGGFWWRMRRRRQDESFAQLSSKRGSIFGKAGGSEMGHSADGIPTFLRGWDPGAKGANAENRNSTLMPVDPRMDPFTLGVYSRNKSHESINTIHDDRDYSRRVHQPKVLRAVNPDPMPDD